MKQILLSKSSKLWSRPMLQTPNGGASGPASKTMMDLGWFEDVYLYPMAMLHMCKKQFA